MCPSYGPTPPMACLFNGGRGGGGPPWPYAKSAPALVHINDVDQHSCFCIHRADGCSRISAHFLF